MLSARVVKAPALGPYLMGSRERLSRTPFCCAAAMGMIACTMFTVFGFAGILLWRYTPIYSAVKCSKVAAHFNDPDIGAETAVLAGRIVPECTNENAYDVTFQSPVTGEVLLVQSEPVNASSVQVIGTADLATSVIQAHSTGALFGELNITVPMLKAMQMLSADSVHAILNLTAHAEAEISILGHTMKMQTDRPELCAVSAKLELPPGKPQVALHCAGSLEELVFPPLDNSSGDKSFELSMGKDDLDNIESTKNLVLGAIMAVTLVLGIAALALMAISLRSLLSRQCDSNSDSNMPPSSMDTERGEAPEYQLPDIDLPRLLSLRSREGPEGSARMVMKKTTSKSVKQEDQSPSGQAVNESEPQSENETRAPSRLSSGWELPEV